MALGVSGGLGVQDVIIATPTVAQVIASQLTILQGSSCPDGWPDGTCRSSLSPVRVARWLKEAADLSPKVFNSGAEAQGGDIVSLQGANFDAGTVVTLDGPDGGSSELPIVNRVDTVQLSVELPRTLVDPVLLRVKNEHGASSPVRLNAARPLHIDATRIVPDGRFRIFGRNLKVLGHHPHVLLDGLMAHVDVGASTAMVLVATVPSEAKPNEQADISVDNGNGTGATSLSAPVAVEAGSGKDTLDLGVGWASAFDFSSRVVVTAAACNGITDDSDAIEASVKEAAQGGGVVQLPEGICRIAKTIDLASRVILRGATHGRTVLLYENNYPVFAEKLDLVGLQDLDIRNASAVQEGLAWRHNTRSFIKRVSLDMQKSRQWFLTDNTDFVFADNTITQTASYDQQNPYRFDRCVGLIFANNISTNTSGSPTFQRVHDSVFEGNRFVRNASIQDEVPVVAHHQFVVDFGYRLSIIDNDFEVLNGPVTNTVRNDGETILIEGGGPLHTDQIGTVSQATIKTLSDPSVTINADPFGTGLPWNMAVAIVAGKGMGQSRRISRYDRGTIEIDRDWDVVPDEQSRYATFVWGLTDALIAGNIMKDNPRGIWLYQAAVRDVVIAGNIIREGGGIYMRAFQSVHQHAFTFQANVLIEGNSIESTTGAWLAHIIVANVRSDPDAFGTAEIGVAVRRNHISANVPNRTSNLEEYASREGFAALVHIENANKQLNAIPAMLGTIFQSNVCDRCKTAFAISTGSFGAVFANNVPSTGTVSGLSDVQMIGGLFGGSTGTVAR